MSTPLHEAPRYLSLTQASAATQLSARTLRRAIQAKDLHAQHIGRLIRIDISELGRWMKADGAAAPGTRANT